MPVTSSDKPVIFLAFAQDRVEGGAYLRNLPIELDGIRKALQKARQAGLCEIVERSNTTVENILDVFQEYQDRIAVFHYGGHADSYELLLESLTGEHAMAHSEGLVSFLAKQKGLQLVFLNGCCSQQQALDLIEAGMPAVVGTSQKIDDGVATKLSLRFYQGLAAGLGIDRAWVEAIDQVKIEKGAANVRGMHGQGLEEASDRFPWEIYYRQGAEIVKDWNLPEAVENPLFGLPEIPKTYDLPETPFLFLKRYERQHAEIFFGRSYYIRDLYNRVSDPNSPPVILLYGQSGVGKSSLFDAGLNPRLEKDYKVIYIRRIQEKGLAGTLAFALHQELGQCSTAPPIPAPAAADSATRQQALRQLESFAQNVDEQIVREEIEALILKLKSNAYEVTSTQYAVSSAQELVTTSRQPQSDSAIPSPHSEIIQQWQQIEARTGKPLLVILDQVEELYTRPNPQQPEELEKFLALLQSLFGSPSERPQGKLLLGYRKEYHPEIEEGFKAHRLPRATLFLESLRKKDILEVFRGLTRTPALKARYNLTVEDELPVMIADDLLEDKDSPVAPVLQIVLTKLWNAANKENAVAPRFTVNQYQQLKKDGIAMGEFFEQQMQQLRRWNPGVVDSGLALDVLHFHITALGTAGTRSLEELRQTYQHRQDLIDSLVGKCKELYLLTEAQHSAAHTSLTHDTLAPVVNNEFNKSDKPGQRAARILNSKMSDFSENGSAVWLDEADLAIVEQGNQGMRRLFAKEDELLKVSREKRRQRQRLRKQLWAGGVVMLLGIVAAAIFAFVKMREAELESRRARSLYLASKAENVSNTNITDAIRIVQAVYALFEDDPPIPVMQALSKIYDRRIKESFYEKKFRHGGYLRSAVFSPDGQKILTASVDKTARLWSLTGDSLALFKHDGYVNSAVFSPDGVKILTASSDSTARLWSPAGDFLAVFKHDSTVFSAEFSPDGQKILTASADKTARLWSLAGDSLNIIRHEKEVHSAVFSLDGQKILTASDDHTAKLWSLAGKSLAVFKHYGPVYSAVFSPDGEKILTASVDGTARLWSLAGAALAVFEYDGEFSSAVFSPNGQKILTTAFRDNTARMWSLAGDSLVVFKHDDPVYSAVFSRDGEKILTASYDNTARLWSLPGESLAAFEHDGAVMSAVFSRDGEKILTASNDYSARLWSLPGDSLAVFEHDDAVSSAVFSPDGQKILTASWDSTARLWSVTGDSLAVFKHDGSVYSAVFSPDGQKILTASSDDSTAQLWSLAGDSLAVFDHDGEVYSAVFSPDGQKILTASDDKTARLWSLIGDSLAEFKHDGTVKSAVFSPDGQKILTASDDKTARLWSLAGDSLAAFKHDSRVNSAVFSPDGKKILTASRDSTAQLWSLAGNSLAEFKHEGDVNSAVFSPNGTKILTASDDKTARLWSLSGASLAEFKHKSYVSYALFSPDGRKILTASYGTARLWSLSGDSLAMFKHDDVVNSAVFSPDGQKILTASGDHTARLVLTPKGIYEWLKTANIYQLSEQEKREYGIQ